MFDTRSVHRIGILDIRLLNTDRHGGNMLVVSRQNDDNGSECGYDLVPIDHAFCLPEFLGDDVWFEWLSWPQAKEPFDESTLEYIRSLDIEEDCAVLRDLGFRPSAIVIARLTHLILQKGAEAGLTLYDIGMILCRQKPDQPSQLEQIFTDVFDNENPLPSSALPSSSSWSVPTSPSALRPTLSEPAPTSMSDDGVLCQVKEEMTHWKNQSGTVFLHY